MATTEQKNDWEKQIIDDEMITLEIPWKTLEKPFQSVLEKASRSLKVDGFRKGKVPAHIAKENINEEYLVKQTLQQVAGEAYNKKLEASKLKPVSDPEFIIMEADEGKAWKIEAHIAVRPKIELKEYKKLLTKAKAEAKKELAEENKKAIAESKKVKKDEKSVVSEAKELTEDQLNNMATDRALGKLHAESAPAVNRLIVTRQASRELEQLLNQLKQFNLELDDYLKNSGQTKEGFSQQLMSSALRNLQMEFILDALIEAEKIEVTDKDIEAKLAEFAPDVKDKKKQKELLDDTYTKNYLEAMSRRQKLAEWLTSL
ncbi:MAG: hypothetical protein LBG64_03685 [Pseudomonadales bacterium]|jgi:FKBP-type peptidyl-prolyl cis-trans isomerase (trigger factor)|nr:hypothetical protein [Pseudomonadales bacterium]